MLLWCSKGLELLPFNRHCPVTFLFPSLFRSSSIISSVVNVVNNSICSWILESGELWRSRASQYPDWKLKWPKSCDVSLAAGTDCAMRNVSTRGMLCHIPWQDKHGPDQSMVQKPHRTNPTSKPTEWASRSSACYIKQWQQFWSDSKVEL